MEEYNLQEIRIEDYNIIKEYYQMRRPERQTAIYLIYIFGLTVIQHGILLMIKD